ncbi:hypothetical protein GLAREA_04169 [Glarea lozoyensis ATCC 20868]|uniref:Uncharacterized protein n=1 Tax=Glarea lozoyensis (strain ATCC 20868 / MF5171) TaxID=1116229 RepID=S3CXZ1_GLAL2|nr:uncharacterized protein GLAREA_04169 [Glarea lozoyensis ATCC 20868]EPE31202.1 hypothetical protein GLAREA_04169 [Glarea lozoyensis ATCC 20868]
MSPRKRKTGADAAEEREGSPDLTRPMKKLRVNANSGSLKVSQTAGDDNGQHQSPSAPITAEAVVDLPRGKGKFARLPPEIVSIIIQYACCTHESSGTQLPDGSIQYRPRSPRLLFHTVLKLLAIVGHLREEILELFLTRKVELSPQATGVRFLQSLSPDEIARYIRDIRVPWCDPRPSDAFRILAKHSKLDYLQVELTLGDEVYKQYERVDSLQRCTGWNAIMSIRECKRVSVMIPLPNFVRDSELYVHFDSSSRTVRRHRVLLTTTCGWPKILTRGRRKENEESNIRSQTKTR